MRYSINKTKYLDDLEQAKLLNTFIMAPGRDSLLLRLLLETGARATEILNVRVSDLSEVDQTVFIKGIKGSNDREIPLSSDLFTLVKGLVDSGSGLPNSGTKLFPISYKRLFQIWNEYKPGPKKLHSLRHTFAINLYKRSRDLRLVQVALGHRNIANTMVYADYIYSKQELRKLLLP